MKEVWYAYEDHAKKVKKEARCKMERRAHSIPTGYVGTIRRGGTCSVKDPL